MIYVAITAFLFFLRFTTKGRPELNNIFYPMVLSALFLFSAFRYEVGCDWTGYENQYHISGLMSIDDVVQGRETLWWLIIHSLNGSGLSYPWINVVSSGIAFFGIHILAKRQPDPLGFLILLFPVLMINMPMSAIRQGAAIGLVCIAITRLLDRKAFAYTLWIFLAASFHSSAMIFVVLAPFIGSRVSKLRVFIAAILVIPGLVLLSSGDSGQVASSRYIGADREAFGAVFRLGLLALSGIMYLIFIRRAWRHDFRNDYALVTLGSFSMIGILAGLPLSSIIMDRLGYYLIPIQAMIFARIPWLSNLPSKALLSAMPYIGLLIFFTVWSLRSGHFQMCYIPYNNWLLGTP